jgi:hypothetical protein
MLENLPPKERFFWALNAEDIATTEEETEIYRDMLKKGISLRRIISKKTSITHDEFETKVIDHQYSDDKGAVFIFADKIALYTAAEGDQEPTTLIITNSRIAETYRKTFSYMWDTLAHPAGKEPKKKGRK